MGNLKVILVSSFSLTNIVGCTVFILVTKITSEFFLFINLFKMEKLRKWHNSPQKFDGRWNRHLIRVHHALPVDKFVVIVGVEFLWGRIQVERCAFCTPKSHRFTVGAPDGMRSCIHPLIVLTTLRDLFADFQLKILGSNLVKIPESTIMSLCVKPLLSNMAKIWFTLKLGSGVLGPTLPALENRPSNRPACTGYRKPPVWAIPSVSANLPTMHQSAVKELDEWLLSYHHDGVASTEARMSAHDTTPGHSASKSALAASIASNPRSVKLGCAVFSVLGPSRSTDPSHPCTRSHNSVLSNRVDHENTNSHSPWMMEYYVGYRCLHRQSSRESGDGGHQVQCHCPLACVGPWHYRQWLPH